MKTGANSKRTRSGAAEAPTALDRILTTTGPAIAAIVLSVASAIGGVAAYLLTPVKGLVNGIIWQESGRLELLGVTSPVSVGETIAVQVFGIAESPVPLSKGILEVEFPKDLMRLSDPSVPLAAETGPIEGAARVTQKDMALVAHSPGVGAIRATLRNKNVALVAEERVEIVDARPGGEPRHANFTGHWRIDLGGVTGTMEILEHRNELKGEYWLNDGQAGHIDGIRDGMTFRATLFRGTLATRYFVNASFDPNPAAPLELRGTAELLLPTGVPDEAWRRQPAGEFYGTAKRQ